MTGLLARMAARAAGEVPLAAPRIPSRFEPFAEELGLPEPAQAMQPAWTPNAASPTPGPDQRRAGATAAEAAPAGVAPVHAYVPPTVAAPISTSLPRSAVVNRREASAPASRPSTAQPAPAAGSPFPAGQMATADRTPGAEVAADATMTAARQIDERPPPATNTEHSRGKPAGPDALATEKSSEMARPINGHHPISYPVAHQAARPETAGAQADSPRPTIEIHIGSIEVRAASAPAPAAARSAPASTSLDAFLSRNRGP